jgi:glycosyltransferase involved in cell wall biosynthesis
MTQGLTTAVASENKAPSVKRRLRIAVLSRTFKSTGGGAERYAMALVEQLAKSHELHVFSQEMEHQWPGVCYHPVSMLLKKPRWINQLWFAAMTWWATRRGFDVVHSHENTWHGQVQTVHVVPIQYNLFHGRTGARLAMRWLKVITSPRLLAYLWLERCRYQVDGKRIIVLTSQSLQSTMAHTYPAAIAAMQVVTPGVTSIPGLANVEDQLAQRKLLGLPDQGQCILFVGNDFQKKGLPVLLEAMRKLPNDAYLAVVGNDERLEKFKEEVQTPALKHRVFFLGVQKNMGSVYRAADCLAHPTLEDTFAMVVLEAMAHGLPVVVSGAHYCGISDLLNNGKNALILENPLDARTLIGALKSVLLDPVLRHELSKAGCTFARAHQWADAARAHEAIYSSIATQTDQ